MFKCYLRPCSLSALYLYGAIQQALNTHIASIKPVINAWDKIIVRYQTLDCGGCWVVFQKCVSKLSSSILVADDSISIQFLQIHILLSSGFRGAAQLLLPGLTCKTWTFSQMPQLLRTDHHHSAAKALRRWLTVQNHTTYRSVI